MNESLPKNISSVIKATGLAAIITCGLVITSPQLKNATVEYFNKANQMLKPYSETLKKVVEATIIATIPGGGTTYLIEKTNFFEELKKYNSQK